MADGGSRVAGPSAVTEQPLATRLIMTTFFAVVREPGPAWDHGKPRAEQEAWAQHAAFMNALAEAGFVVLGGPLGDGSRNLLIVDAVSGHGVESRLAQDPRCPMGPATGR